MQLFENHIEKAWILSRFWEDFCGFGWPGGDFWEDLVPLKQFWGGCWHQKPKKSRKQNDDAFLRRKREREYGMAGRLGGIGEAETAKLTGRNGTESEIWTPVGLLGRRAGRIEKAWILSRF